MLFYFFFFSSRRRHTRLQGDWSSDVCSSDLTVPAVFVHLPTRRDCCCGRGYLAAVRMTRALDRKSTRLNSSHLVISYAVFCLKKKKKYTYSICNPSLLKQRLRSLKL